MNRAKLLCPIGILLLAVSADRVHAQPRTLHLTLQNRDPNTSQVMLTTEEVDSAKVAVVVVDLWNFHWCKTATMRVDALIPRMNKALEDVQIPPGSKIISLATIDDGDGNKEDHANWVQCGFIWKAGAAQ